MAVTKESFEEHRKKYGVTYMINFFGSLLPVAALALMFVTQFGKLATDVELATAMSSHMTGKHTTTDREIQQIQGDVDSILILSLQDRIEKLLLAECKNPALRASLETTIRQLIRDYNSKSKIPYDRPDCQQLELTK